MLSSEKLKKLKELNERARIKMLANPNPVEIKTVLVLYNGRLVDMPEDIAKKSGLPYFFD